MPRLLIAAILACALEPALDACTTFCVRSGDCVLFGRNYDFEIGDGMVMVNAAGAVRKGFLDGGPSWRAAHGSVTFNQFGRGFPMGGMNQAGVVVELMWLNDTRYPAADERKPLGVLEWIQYQLDTAASVDDVVASDARVRIQGQTPLHYLVSDRTGAAVTIEFLDGTLTTHRGATMRYSALANDTYARSIAFVERLGGKQAGGSGSLERFSRAALALPDVAKGPGNPLPRAFAVLADVSQRTTRWSIVYDQTAGVIHWRTDRHQPIRHLRMADVGFGCGTERLAIDVHAPVSGDARPAMVPLTAEANLALVRGSTKQTSFTRQTPEPQIMAQAGHGWAQTCAGS